MSILPLPYCYIEESDQEHIILRVLKSRVAACLLLAIAILNPIESFAANCQIVSTTCMDPTPCKSIGGVSICLATVNPLPAGAMRTSSSCWNTQAVYDCQNLNATMSDSCSALRTDPKCGIISSTCIITDSAGNCTSYSDTFQCQTGGGIQTVSQDCSGQTFCANGTCFVKRDKPNNSLAKVVAGMELSRQAGFYMDEKDQTVFKGQAAWCSQNTAGLSDCCKPNAMGMSFTDALIADELIKMGWNTWIQNVVGSEYTFDTLYDSAMPYVTKAVDGMSEVVSGWVNSGAQDSVSTAAAQVSNQASGAAGNIATTGTATAGSGTAVAGSTQNGTGVSGAIGGAAGQYAANKLAGNQGKYGNAVIGATGNQVGAYAGTYAYSYGSAALSGSTFTAGAFCWPCLAIAVAIAIVMAMLACDENEAKTQLKLGAGLCHHVGSQCVTKVLNSCVTDGQHYCCFNSKLAKIVQEQGRPQLGRGWGSDVTNPDCTGITVNELQKLDFSKMDLSEFMADVTNKVAPDPGQLQDNIKKRLDTYFAANPPMNGVIPGPNAPPPTTIKVAITPLPAAPTIPMPACTTTLTKGSPDPVTGDVSGTFTVTSCLPNGTAWFGYSGNCAGLIPPTFTQVPVAIDAAGNASFGVVAPKACLAATNPVTINMWTAIVQDPATNQSIGKFEALWK